MQGRYYWILRKEGAQVGEAKAQFNSTTLKISHGEKNNWHQIAGNTLLVSTSTRDSQVTILQRIKTAVLAAKHPANGKCRPLPIFFAHIFGLIRAISCVGVATFAWCHMRSQSLRDSHCVPASQCILWISIDLPTQLCSIHHGYLCKYEAHQTSVTTK